MAATTSAAMLESNAKNVVARLSLVGLLYTVSGSLGLVYEVAFDKYLGYIFGATAYASSAVLVAFMGGLALGARIAGLFEKRIARPLVAYAVCEVIIGCFCMFSPRMFKGLASLYVSLLAHNTGSLATISLMRAGLGVLVVVVPAAGMGATLPLLARFVQAEDPLSGTRRLARLYALNTLGGAIGSLLSAYWIIPGLGLAQTMRTSAAMSMTIGAIAIVLGWDLRLPREDKKKVVAPVIAAADRQAWNDALIQSAASGLLVFACEVVFVHLLALVIGSSVYAFGLMLAIFLICLSLGTPVATRLMMRFGPGASSALGFAGAGVALLASLIIWDRLPGIFIALGPVVKSWPARETTRGLIAAAALCIPAIAMGTTFPLILRSVRAASITSDVGRLTVANTVGSIAGSILAGFVLLPRLGSQRSLIVIGIVYLCVGAFALRGNHEKKVGTHVGALVAAGVLLALLVPSWDLARLTSGANVYFNDGTVPGGVVESIAEDVHGGVTTVVRGPDGQRTLLTNGKFEGNDGKEIEDNRGFVHLPVVFCAQRKRALTIGLGTGVTAATVAAYDFEKIDAVELSPAVIREARTTFAAVNGHLLEDPRVNLRIDDGRNVLFVNHNVEYDFIGMQISSIWFAGAANLYNREFYTLVSSRLSKGGVFQQWIQLHHTNRRILASTIATVRDVFQHMLLAVTGHQALLVASQEPMKVTRDHLATLERIPTLKKLLDGRHLADYVKTIILDERGIDAFLDDTQVDSELARWQLMSTDENLYLEYATPKLNVPTADDIPDTLAYLNNYRRADTLPVHLLP